MSKPRYRINTDFIKYPDRQSARRIERAGGLRRMEEKERMELNITRGLRGKPCDDMLPQDLAHYLADGRVVEGTTKVARKGPGKGRK